MKPMRIQNLTLSDGMKTEQFEESHKIVATKQFIWVSLRYLPSP